MLLRERNKYGHMSVWYIERWGFSINEGGLPINLTVLWGNDRLFYVRWFGWRVSWMPERGWQRKRIEVWPGWRGYWRERKVCE